MKLLMLCRRDNPNEQERAAAKAQVEEAMAMAGVKLQELQELFWEWSGLPLALPMVSSPRLEGRQQQLGPAAGPVGPRERSKRKAGVHWEVCPLPPPWVHPRLRGPSESKRYTIKRRVEEAVSEALPVRSPMVPVDLHEFQELLGQRGVRCVLHHNPTFLLELGYLDVTRLGFIVDEEPGTHLEGSWIGKGAGHGGLGLMRLVKLGLRISHVNMVHREVARESLVGLHFPEEDHPLREPGDDFKVKLQDRIDEALGHSYVDVPEFLSRLREHGLVMRLKEPERIALGLSPAGMHYDACGLKIFPCWLGYGYSWFGLVARGLFINLAKASHRQALEGCLHPDS